MGPTEYGQETGNEAFSKRQKKAMQRIFYEKVEKKHTTELNRSNGNKYENVDILLLIRREACEREREEAEIIIIEK